MHDAANTPLSSFLDGKPIALLGCGKMGSALLAGWRAAGLPRDGALIVDPAMPPEARTALEADGARFVDRVGAREAAVVVLAVKPQTMTDAIAKVADAEGALFVSIAAGLPIAYFEQRLPTGAAIVRTMPNTPAAVGAGVTAMFGNAAAGDVEMRAAETLMGVVGETVRLDAESQMDAVTAVSGSGPAYVFHMIEALAAAGVAEGLSAPLALRLARATVAGAGKLAVETGEDPSDLRVAVTSKGGTTAAGLAQLMDGSEGLSPLMRRTVAAAAERSRELGG